MEEEGTKRGISMESKESSTVGVKKSPGSVSLPNKNTIIDIIWEYFIKYKKIHLNSTNKK